MELDTDEHIQITSVELDTDEHIRITAGPVWSWTVRVRLNITITVMATGMLRLIFTVPLRLGGNKG